MPETPLWTSAEIVAATGGTLAGPAFEATGLTYNSREIAPGDLFLALKGARDGHDFAAAAFAAGATGALAEHAVDGGPSVIVSDTLRGLEALGMAARDRTPARRGAVTGSVGKTSVTQAIKAGLDLAGPSHASIKSYNNHIGVPLTLARMPRTTERAVFEIGMNAPGEIAPLSRMVRPHAACVTTVGPVHIEAFADGEAGVAAEKATIFEGLAEDGVAVFNADVAFAAVLDAGARRAGARIATFGSGAGCDARLIDFQPHETGARVRAELFGRPIDFQLAQSGFHWGLNSLCVLLMLDALDVSLDTALAALSEFQPLAGRGQTMTVHAPGGDFTLIDESYNANPLSMAAGFRSLGARQPSAGGRRVVVLTDMLELGDQSEALHEGLAGPIDAAGLDLVHAAGPEMKRLYDDLPGSRQGLWRETAAELAAEAAMLVGKGDIVMVKGSNGSKASLVAKALAALGGAA
ncbi:MAG: UDP-N-acetylmuramoyl-tripeptide--D-alanyl-D-alanine ligase [Alphaproteobacteria bacterium]|uniref:UDP-N-acetylmuramoyl-tripeptide--D-alanyl-D- alanine ligase n=1 Tax=Brevundimonas sp. TaxID=1871086 RepID=UPI0017B648DA|nr:UDP-N-acetylmuramoyl-tripeptide--D-alanyl-D-alanine ligase [Brevundimonas sp.]MBA3048975.1 UDP-N-acetylmuramoyl-tripeptide--D-alanyl-D-alanine ligase [Brevundimonas sp.]MBU3970188.1 UDP-N-acetylmuramoyl-tripeptide--D-alanyl-D-alanine ligase [Alphaproteobacteria bacterium]MBU3972263.1 UDP-N-acetylmuramoyl-tripeptide--D-alanyl-D-alanine ligase [Alphaproteobacteria bacterium]MBU4040345.1 UDP-N-acetylmuramoyl-tripeptide--D-alanyl-D-alanine ligase [Alphaproteobacteria bacterium]